MTDTAMTSAERIKRLDMECVHLRRKLDDANRRADWLRDRLRERRSHRISAKERRILDMWPRFEDGEPVWFGEELDFGGDVQQVQEFRFMRDSIAMADEFDYEEHFEISERVKRPAPEVLDADGVPIKVGGTVRSKDGCEAVVTKVERDRVFTGFENMFCTAYEPSDITHREPDSWERLERDAHNIIDTQFPAYLRDKLGDLVDDTIRHAKLISGVE